MCHRAGHTTHRDPSATVLGQRTRVPEAGAGSRPPDPACNDPVVGWVRAHDTDNGDRRSHDVIPGDTGERLRGVTGPPGCPGQALSRRWVLVAAGGAAAVGALGLGGCSSGTDHRSGRGDAPDPDEQARGRAVSDARHLAADLMALAAAHPELGGLPARLAARHHLQLAVLGIPVTSGSAAATSTPDGTGTAHGTPGAAPSPAAVVTAERATAVTALTQLGAVGADTASLLAQLAAADAVHADLLTSAAGLPAPGALPLPATTVATTTSATDGNTRTALTRMLAGEHAAVYAYGVVTARVSDRLRERATAGWQAHVLRRDALEETLLHAGVTPPAAAAAYGLGTMTPGSTGAVALATRVEAAVTEVAVQAVRLTRAQHRTEAAVAVVDAARRQASWTRGPVTLPALPAEF